MEFKDIDNLLFKINDVFAFEHKVDFVQSESEILKQGKERKALLYLKDDLKLIKELFYSTEKVTYTLTLKGNEVIKDGGYGKYYRKIKIKEKWKRIMNIISFWFNIVVPVLALLVAYWSIKSDNHKNKEDIINEVILLQKKQDKKQQEHIEILTKRMDSVLLKTEQQNENN